MITRFLLICLAGAIGTGARYLIGLWAVRTCGDQLPWGTLVVNVLGCFLIAIVMHASTAGAHFSETARLAIVTGFLGGLTTYSAFNYETTRLVEQRGLGAGATSFALTTIGCLLSGVLGLVLARRLFPTG